MLFEIKKCDLSDLDELTVMYDNLIFYMDSTNSNYPKWTYRQYPARASIRAAILSDSQYACLCDGRLCGAFVLNTDPQGAYNKAKWSIDLKDGEYTVIHSLGVVQTMYGCGIGSSMVEYCKKKSKNDGFRAVRVDVVPSNYPAIRMYEKAGFKYVAEMDIERGIEEIPTFLLLEFVIA